MHAVFSCGKTHRSFPRLFERMVASFSKSVVLPLISFVYQSVRKAKMLFKLFYLNISMAETNVSLVYRALTSSLASSEVKIVDSHAVSAIAKSLGFKPNVVLNGLVRGGYLLPVYFSGVYYLLDSDELNTKYLKKKSFEIVAAACNHCFGKNWYYGLGSSLYLGGITGQSPKEFFIITDSHLPVLFEFGGIAFRIRKLSVKDYSLEIKEGGLLRFSSPARTLTDYLYFYLKEGKRDYAVEVASGIIHSFPKAKAHLNNKLISIYPSPYNLAVAYAADLVRDRNV